MTGSHRIEGLAIPPALDLLHDLFDRVRDDHPEVSAADLMAFETGIVEVAGNVVKYGRPPGSVLYTFELTVHDDRLHGRLSDTSEPFEGDLAATVMPGDELSEGGRGLALAGAVLDTFTYRRTAHENVWEMVRIRR